MKRSISILLPVENRQSSLSQEVHEYLEVVSELTDRFEILVVDDGSIDATSEVAHELAVRFPQVSAYGHGRKHGRGQAIRTALSQAQGDVVFLRDLESAIPVDDMTRLWQHADRHEVILGHRLSLDVGAPVNQPACGMQLIARSVALSIGESLIDRQQLLAYLTRHNLDWFEVMLGESERTVEQRLEDKASEIARQILEGPRRPKMVRPPVSKTAKKPLSGPKFVRMMEQQPQRER